ncbi:MAG TPA: UDP-N-acetylmuramoyl-tripeptide--D-alanyl-D-alanine ligase [Rhodocyclaceae bacterium]|nr:UDP-N-acetylmuramoyl-tripeptide--D-alanyl-D-alanine ligase [Rhodocyclaceae bacterium]
MRLHEAAAALNIAPVGGGEREIAHIGTDSRNVRAGELFVALRGERFDGHDFVGQAAAAGAVAALVDAQWAQAHPQAEVPLLVVDDTRSALGTLAAWWRGRFDIPVIGVTGSNGKTTVKEMCAAIMRAQAARDGFDAAAVLATRGNLNNDIGVPLTLFGLDEGHRAAIIEMGMNRPGEIARLTLLARPTVAIVTNAQRAHLQGMGTVVSIAEEKGAIYGGLGSAGIAVINADDPHADYWRGLNASRRTVGFGLTRPADVQGRCTLQGLGSELVLTTPAGAVTVALQVPGEHNARNALGAAAACLAAGASLQAVSDGLAAYTGTRGRLERRAGANGATLLDDSYNANPDSVRAAIDVLASTPGRKILVLGDMGEMGWTSAQVHDEIGGYAKSKGVDALFALGDMSAVAVHNFGDGGRHFKAVDALVAALRPELDARTVVLVKGSRFMRMERVVEALVAVHNAPPSNEGDPHVA